ncbi:MAG TPA: hypothetical protein VM938_09290 [Acidimicrobiales bacterium]|nr:hypothetical protein [Acidimicrobiales bacterium]
MPTLAVEDDDLVVRFSGLEAAYALRRTVRIPRTAVVSAAVGPPPKRRGLRAPGAHLPGRLSFGTWRGRFGKDLWGVHRGERVVVIELDGGAAFERLVLEVDDPGGVVAALRQAAFGR